MAKTHSREKTVARLEQSMSIELPLKIKRFPTPGETFNGVVLDIGVDWVLLAKIRDGGYVDGYSILRIDTIRKAKVETTFLPFLLAHQLWPPAKPEEPIDLSGPAAFVADIEQIAKVMTCFEEKRYPDMLWIGAPFQSNEKFMELVTISPDANWQDSYIKFNLRRLTRIDFSDDYANAIFELAGPVPWQDPEPPTSMK